MPSNDKVYHVIRSGSICGSGYGGKIEVKPTYLDMKSLIKATAHLKGKSPVGDGAVIICIAPSMKTYCSGFVHGESLCFKVCARSYDYKGYVGWSLQLQDVRHPMAPKEDESDSDSDDLESEPVEIKTRVKKLNRKRIVIPDGMISDKGDLAKRLGDVVHLPLELETVSPSGLDGDCSDSSCSSNCEQ